MIGASAARPARSEHGDEIMGLPFSTEQFLGVFERYNQAIWPAQVVAYILGLAAVTLVLRPSGPGNRMIGAILAFFWLWMGAVYHLTYFSAINPAAIIFGVLFVAQGVLWLVVGVVRPRLAFRADLSAPSILGGVLVL
jgi:hypothetical protein